MEKEKRRPASRAYGCRRLFVGACLALSLICSVPLVLTSPELHWHIDNNIKRDILMPVPVNKESDMIAFICKKFSEYPRNMLYTVYSDGSHLKRVRQHPFERYRHISWSPDGIWIAMIVENLAYNLWEALNMRFIGFVLMDWIPGV